MNEEFKICPHCHSWIKVVTTSPNMHIEKPTKEEMKKHEIRDRV